MVGDGSPIKLGDETLLTSLLLVYDTEAETQTSVYGKTEFIQLVGIMKREVDAIMEDRSRIALLIQRMKEDGNPDLVTDLKRTKAYL